MKKTLILLVYILLFGCKSDKKILCRKQMDNDIFIKKIEIESALYLWFRLYGSFPDTNSGLNHIIYDNKFKKSCINCIKDLDIVDSCGVKIEYFNMNEKSSILLFCGYNGKCGDYDDRSYQILYKNYDEREFGVEPPIK